MNNLLKIMISTLAIQEALNGHMGILEHDILGPMSGILHLAGK